MSGFSSNKRTRFGSMHRPYCRNLRERAVVSICCARARRQGTHQALVPPYVERVPPEVSVCLHAKNPEGAVKEGRYASGQAGPSSASWEGDGHAGSPEAHEDRTKGRVEVDQGGEGVGHGADVCGGEGSGSGGGRGREGEGRVRAGRVLEGNEGGEKGRRRTGAGRTWQGAAAVAISSEEGPLLFEGAGPGSPSQPIALALAAGGHLPQAARPDPSQFPPPAVPPAPPRSGNEGSPALCRSRDRLLPLPRSV